MKKIKTYQRFFAFLLAWLDRSIESLVVVGTPGVGKSWAGRELLKGRPHHWFSARQTPLQVYNQLCDNPDWPVVFDDVPALLTDGDFVDMFKNLCVDGVATVRWGSPTAKLEGRPTSFRCTSPVLILLNKMPYADPDVVAVPDRCHNIEFKPVKSEVIAYMRKYFPGDGELIDLLADLAIMPNIRTLLKARQWARSEYLNLREELLADCGVPEGVALLIEIMERFPKAEWRDRYMKATGQTDRQFRRNRKAAAEVLACRGTEDGCPNVRHS